MRRDVLLAARALSLPALALIGVALAAPGRLELAARICALLVCIAASAVLLLALRRAYPEETRVPEPVRRAVGRMPPPTLAQMEHETALAVAGSFDLHYRLAPHLRALATGLLSSRRQISLRDGPDTARVILGENAWELVRPGRPAPEDRLARGLEPAELGKVVDALEAI